MTAHDDRARDERPGVDVKGDLDSEQVAAVGRELLGEVDR